MKVVRKVLHCTARGIWVFKISSPLCEAVPCAVKQRVWLTPAMKDFIAQQDESSIPTRVILVNLKKKKQSHITQNLLFYIRRDQGANNSIKAAQVRA